MRNSSGLVAALAMLAVSAAAAPEIPYPTKSIRLISPFPPGGGNDTMARAGRLVPMLTVASKTALAAAASALLISVGAAAQAQDYPTRPVRFVVPYVPGGGVAVTDLMAGQISMYFGTTPSTMPHVRTGRLRALGVTTAKRTPAAPDVPTIAEAGLPGYEQSAWHGLLAPAGTPQAIITKLHAEVLRALRSPEVAERFAVQGIDVIGSSPAEFAAFIKQDLAKYEKLVRTAGIRID